MLRKIPRLLSTRHWHFLELVCVILILSVVLFNKAKNVSFHIDERAWISWSDYLEAFVKLDLDSQYWQTRKETLTQPPMTRYIVGVGRLLGGYSSEDISVYRKEDRLPDLHLLWWSRLPMLILTIACGLLLFLASRSLAGPLAAYTTLCLFILNSYLPLLLRAMGEAPLLIFVMLAALSLFCALKVFDRQDHNDSHLPENLSSTSKASAPKQTRPWHVVRWMILMGVFSGLAGASKLNGVAVIGAATLLGVSILIRERVLSKKVRWFVCSSIFLAPVFAIFTFILVNPYLYRSPVWNTLGMLDNRLHESANQQKLPAQWALRSMNQRLNAISNRFRFSYRQITKRQPFVLFGITGFIYLLFLSGNWFSKSRDIKGQSNRNAAIVILLAAVTSSLPSFVSPLDWDRYFLFPIVLYMLCAGLGIAISINWIARLVWRIFCNFRLQSETR